MTIAKHPNILLSGFMGAGKSTLLKSWSHGNTAFNFMDLDDLLFSKLKKSDDKNLGECINRIGWEIFRKEEKALLFQIIKSEKPVVLALGGGALDAASRIRLNDSKENIIVYLDTPFEVCFSRISQQDGRPLALKNKQELQELFEERLNTYKTADFSPSQEDQETGFSDFLKNI